MAFLTRLTLTNFRNYASLIWRPAARIAVLTGPNGSGKTNLLEAVSLLGPGRGFGRSRLSEMARHGGDGLWAVAARVQTADSLASIGTGLAEPNADRRTFRLDGANPRNQAEIAQILTAIWLTPQMDTLFQEGASGRLRFLDRLVWALEPGHAREATAHDTAMAERRRVLALARERGGAPDPGWLAGLEDAIARHGVAVSAARAGAVARLNAAAAGVAEFPGTRVGLQDMVADRLAGAPALAVESWLREGLAARRSADMVAGTSTLGAHRADMRLADAATGLPAERASTGQQKAMLIGLILAHATLLAETRAQPPILLLDEPAVHLDDARRRALWAELSKLDAQILLTGTDADVFAPMRGTAEFLRTGGGALVAG